MENSDISLRKQFLRELFEKDDNEKDKFFMTKSDSMNQNSANDESYFNVRNPDIFSVGQTTEQLKTYLASQNPNRKNIDYTAKDIFSLQLMNKLCGPAACVNAFNEMVKDVAKFIEEHKIKTPLNAKVEIRVKIVDKKTRYETKSDIYPNELLKNKNLKQYITFVAVSSVKETEIISIPMMVGCEWCATYGKTPEELHAAGENADGYKGYFIIESQKSTEAKYLIAQKKVSHNIIVTIYDERSDRKCYLTTLKTQDHMNNSIETNIYKKNNIVYLDTPDFNIKYPVIKIFRQIYLLMKELNDKDPNLIYYEEYSSFMERIVEIAAGTEIKTFFKFDYTDNDMEPIKLPDGSVDVETGLRILFKNEDRKNLYANLGADLSEDKHFPKILINSILPSVDVPDIPGEKNNSENQKLLNIYQAKAILLVKMVLMNYLCEKENIKQTDRDDLSFKSFTNAAEYFRIHLTRDGGKLIKDAQASTIFKPTSGPSKGDSNIFEALPFANNLDVISKVMATSTPRSSLSKNIKIRGVHWSQAGYECIYETPAGSNIGLVLRMASLAMYSSPKNIKKFLNYLIEILVKQMNYSGSNLFKKNINTSKDIIIYDLLKKYQLKISEVLFFRNNDLEAYMKVENIVEKNEKFYVENGYMLKIYLKIYNYISNSNFKPSDLFENLEKVSGINIENLNKTITKQKWLEFLEFRELFLTQKAILEILIPDHEIDINRRLNFWKEIQNKNLDYEDIIDLSKRIKKPISLNSVPFGLINEYDYQKLRKILKRDYKFMDIAIYDEVYKIKTGQMETDYVNSYNILCDGGRICRPLFVCDELKKRNFIGDKKSFYEYLSKTTRFEDIIADGVVEIVFPIELQNCYIAENIDKIDKNENFHQKYCEIDDASLFGVVSSCAPMLNHNPGNRAIHESAMAKAALNEISTNVETLSETSAKLLHGAEVSLVTTKTAEFFTGYLRNGINMLMAIKMDSGNVEDSFVINERFAKSNTVQRISTYDIVVGENEVRGIPKDTINVGGRIYHAVCSLSGLPRDKAKLNVGDIIFAKFKKEIVRQELPDGSVIEKYNYVNSSVQIEEGKDGIVDKIMQVANDKVLTYRITVKSTKNIEVGDKIASRYSQKGVEGEEIPYEKIPYCITPGFEGMRPDGYYSSMSFPSRCTPGLVHEPILGNYAVESGNQVDASSFFMSEEKIIEMNNYLVKEKGYPEWSVFEFIDPETKQKFKMTCGYVYVRILKHTAIDKQKACGFIDHSIDKSTKQPSGGGPTGALRINYMDTNCFCSYGTISMINSLLCTQSDCTTLPICRLCGHICDRYNDDIKTTVDYYAARYCTKCRFPDNIVMVKIPHAAKKVHDEMLSVMIKLSFIPGIKNV